MNRSEDEIRATIKERLKEIRGTESQDEFARRVLGDRDLNRLKN